MELENPPSAEAQSPAAETPARKAIRNLSVAELERECLALGLKRYNAQQVFQWLHQKWAGSFGEMTNLSKDVRALLESHYEVSLLDMTGRHESADGTIKYVFTTRDGGRVESVMIPEENRTTLCISTQVGCAMACSFCVTGTLGLKRNLQCAEIVEQVYQVARDLRYLRPITNLVYMGMGEPLHNIDAVISSIHLLLDQKGCNFSRRRITVSTSGLVRQMERLGAETPVNLAVSLNATTDEVRDVIMPVNRKWPIAELMDACRRFPIANGRRILIEYVMLAGVNDSLDDAKRLAGLVQGVECKINLLPYNEGPIAAYRRPSDEAVAAFQNHLISQGLTVFVRVSRGRDIGAACGQLGKGKYDVPGVIPPRRSPLRMSGAHVHAE
ncbi:MAG: Dual-specificity RNA methyltransferase RlmN [Myxococcota bacterium]|nr:Dual-specificity RNA methyltransferase RlmN [Myxococcota bacterium]